MSSVMVTVLVQEESQSCELSVTPNGRPGTVQQSPLHAPNQVYTTLSADNMIQPAIVNYSIVEVLIMKKISNNVKLCMYVL